jgi:hypothetical protein
VPLHRKRTGVLVLILVVGALVGSGLGKVLGTVIPEGPARDFFIRAVEIGFSPFTLNLAIIRLTLGFTFEINIITILGVLLLAYVLKWF